MAYEVLARKWRPQRFEDVVGQDHVTATLRNAITAQRLAHAYLFVGPRGIGKTSIARIFARALNCVRGPTPEPCGECDSCREIAAGTNLDVLEIDGASNTGVDHVRDLRETVRYAPTRGPFKIYIIDEVHMLSVSAFNALLKTLEEPPPHVKFIFATTEPQKMLATVLSRCQRFDLRRIAVPLIVERLRLMAQAEGVQADEEALLAVARGAEGGLRDAQSALDQLIAFRGDTIVEADVLAVFGLVSRAQLEALAGAVLAGDVAGLLALVAELDQSGKDLTRLVVELMEHFRNLLVFLNVENPERHMELTDLQLETLRLQAKGLETGRVLRVVQLLAEAEDRMKFALSRRTLLETSLIRAARAATVVTLEEILKQIQALRASGGAGATVAAPSLSPPPTAPARPAGPAREIPRGGTRPPAAPTAQVREKPTPDSAPEVALEDTSEVAPDTAPDAATAAESDAAALGRLQAGWSEIVEQVGRRSIRARAIVGAILSNTRPVSVESERVVVGYDREFADEIEGFGGGREQTAWELTLGALLKRKVRVAFTPVEGVLDAPPPPAPPAPAAEAPPAPRAAATPGGGARARQAAAQDPLVRKTLDIFNGTILDVRD